MAKIVEAEKKEILKTLRALGDTHGPERVYRDWCNMFALAISNKVTPRGSELWKRRENEYEAIRKTYGDIAPFADMSAHLVNIFEAQPFADHLGVIYMEVFGGNKHLGQCFTPYSVSQVVARLAIGEPVAEFKTANDCACGGGALLIAACEHYHNAGVNYQTYLKLFAEDLDALCVHMCYIQLSLIGARAIVTRRNTLSMETFERFVTPMEYFWPMTLGIPEKAAEMPQNGAIEQKTGESSPETIKTPQRSNLGPKKPIQLRLFPEV